MVEDPLRSVWPCLDSDDGAVAYDEIQLWPNGSFNQLCKIGLISAGPAIRTVTCDQCGDDHLCDVFSESAPDGTTRHWHICPQAGRVCVELERLRLWTVDRQKLVQLIAAALGSGGEALALIDSELWRLGALPIGGTVYPVMVALGIREPTPLAGFLTSGTIVLAAGPRTVKCLVELNSATVIPLEGLAVWSEEGMNISQTILKIRVSNITSEIAVTAQYEVLPPGTIIYKGRIHECELTNKQLAFMKIVLPNTETDINTVMHTRKGAVWPEKYLPKQQKRNKVSQLIGRLNLRLLDAKPPLNVQFSIKKSSDFILRSDPANSVKTPRQ